MGSLFVSSEHSLGGTVLRFVSHNQSLVCFRARGNERQLEAAVTMRARARTWCTSVWVIPQIPSWEKKTEKRYFCYRFQAIQGGYVRSNPSGLILVATIEVAIAPRCLSCRDRVDAVSAHFDKARRNVHYDQHACRRNSSGYSRAFNFLSSTTDNCLDS